MKLAIFSLILNHHQVCIADEFFKILGKDFIFVETAECYDNKGSSNDYSKRIYLLQAWNSPESFEKAMYIARHANVCIFGGSDSLPFEKERMKLGLLSFDMGERMLKRGWINLASPRILKMISAYHLGNWKNKPLYKLCCSSFAKEDQYKLRSFKNRCYKWGYFISVPEEYYETSSADGSVRFMWCARLLKLKHPELVIGMAKKLKVCGYKFHLDIYGDEGNALASEELFSRKALEALVERLDVNDCVTLYGNRPNNEIIEAMKKHDVFLFTSDNREGWGAVVNESMANSCAVISSDAIGSTAYLVKNGVTGFSFRNCDLDDLTEKAKWIIEHPKELRQMKRNANSLMKSVWSPQKAAENLLDLIDDLQSGRESSITEGPCSKA